MTSLRALEVHEGLNAYTGGAVKESLRHIVGVQFRNCATVGGSLWKFRPFRFLRCSDHVSGASYRGGAL